MQSDGQTNMQDEGTGCTLCYPLQPARLDKCILLCSYTTCVPDQAPAADCRTPAYLIVLPGLDLAGDTACDFHAQLRQHMQLARVVGLTAGDATQSSNSRRTRRDEQCSHGSDKGVCNSNWIAGERFIQ